MSNVQNILKTIKDKEIQFVDLRFTDPRGKMQHVSQHVSTIDEDSLAEGFMFDGSSILFTTNISNFLRRVRSNIR